MNLRCHTHMVLKTNPGSMTIVQSDSYGQPPHSKRVFIYLKTCWRGFIKGCRPVIGLDGCHLKGPYGGVLLAAISMDANLLFFALAYAIVEVEGNES